MTRRRITGRRVFIAVIALTALAVVLLAVLRPPPPEAVFPDEPPVAVTVMTVEPVALPDILSLPGRVRAWEDVIVGVEQPGRIHDVLVDEGQSVARGDILLRVDDRVWWQHVRQAELRARDAARDLARARDLRQEGALSQRDLDAASSAVDAAEIALAEARVQWERCAPTAPFDGVIEQRMVSTGAYVAAGQAGVRMLDVSRVKVGFDLPERDILAARPGAPLTFRCDALPGHVFTGVVSYVSAAAHPAANTFRIDLDVANADGTLRGGMLANVAFERAALENAIMVPLAAVVPMEGESVVYVAEAGRAARRIVRMDRILADQAVLRDGVRAGDQVILDGNRAVLDGSPITIVPAWSPTPPETP